MSEKKYKVSNPNIYSVGIKFMDGIRTQNVKPGSFVMLTEDEIYYLHSISRLFKKGALTTSEKHININLGLIENEDEDFKNYNALTEAEVEEILNLPISKMSQELENIEEDHIKFRVFEIAKTLDLPVSKLKEVEHYTGRKFDLEDIVKEDIKPAKTTKKPTTKKSTKNK